MKLEYYLLLVAYFHTGCYCQTDSRKKYNTTNTEIIHDPSGKTVKFVLFTREDVDNGTEIEENVCNLRQIPVKFIVHGFEEKGHIFWSKNLTRVFLAKGDFNVFLVDWGVLANQPYLASVDSAETIGNRIGELIIKIHKEKTIPYTDFHIIGHSLGAHIGGFAGKKVIQITGSKIGIITGLDAARDEFEDPPKLPSQRLYYEDAVIVENLHTDSGVLGYLKPIGTIDYYPNGGNRSQPKCCAGDIPPFAVELLPLRSDCSHRKSYEFYIRAWLQDGIITRKCDSYVAFKAENCTSNEINILGVQKPNQHHNGTFYFDII